MSWRPDKDPLLVSQTVSSLATADEGAAHRPPETTRRPRAVPRRLSTDALFGLALAAGLTVLAFVTTGGTDLGTDGLGPNTWAEIVLVLIGTALAVAVVVADARGRVWGAGTLLAFAALTALTAVSIAWSVQPANSWQAADQMFSYLLAFGGAVALARLVPGRWPGVVGAMALLATVVCGWALLVKVFPATLDPGELYGRLRAPFGYWNATGLTAALGLPAGHVGRRTPGGKSGHASARGTGAVVARGGPNPLLFAGRGRSRRDRNRLLVCGGAASLARCAGALARDRGRSRDRALGTGDSRPISRPCGAGPSNHRRAQVRSGAARGPGAGDDRGIRSHPRDGSPIAVGRAAATDRDRPRRGGRARTARGNRRAGRVLPGADGRGFTPLEHLDQHQRGRLQRLEPAHRSSGAAARATGARR